MQDLLKGKQYQHLSLAQTYPNGFKALYYEAIKEDVNEGLVMKNKKGKIVWNTKSSPDVYWQVKARLISSLVVRDYYNKRNYFQKFSRNSFMINSF